MEEPGSFSGRTSSPEPAARARAEPAQVVGDLHERHGQGAQRTVSEDERIVRGQGGELVRRAHEGQAGRLCDGPGHPLAELGMRVEPGPDGGAAERQFVEPGQGRLDPLRRRRPAGPRNPENSCPSVRGTASMRWVRPIFVTCAKASSFSWRASRSARTEGTQPVHDLLDRRDVHRGGEGVVRRLRHVHVVVGMDRLLGAHHPARQLNRPVRDDLVGVHVGLGPASRLPDRGAGSARRARPWPPRTTPARSGRPGRRRACPGHG